MRQFAAVLVELTSGDITAQPDVDAVVNAANAQLAPGGGVAGAIHRAAGPGLARAAAALAPIDVGQAVATLAFDLPNEHVIHVLGPRYGTDEPADELLASAYRNALTVADGLALRSIAFPAISTGIFGYPLEEAARIAVTTVAEVAPTLTTIRLVRFVLFDADALGAHQQALAALPDHGS